MIDAYDLEMHHTVKCYNGAWDSQTERVFARQDKAMRRIKQVEPEAHVTYFALAPCDTTEHEVFQMHVWGRPLSGYHKTKGAAIAEVFNRLFPDEVL